MGQELDYLPHHLPKYHETDDPDVKAQIRERVVQARMVKVPIDKVAKEHGVSIQTVHKWVAEYAKEAMGDFDPELFRAHDALTLDALEANAWKILAGLMNPPAGCPPDVDMIIKAQTHVAKLQEQKSKLLGYIAPQRVIHNTPIRSEYDPELESMVSVFMAATTGAGGQLMSKPEEVYSREGEGAP